MSPPRRLALHVFIDAYGWEVLQRQPLLADLLPHRQPLGTIFGYSSTCIPTILTGVLPREHGHFSCFRYDPEHSPFQACRWLDLLPRSLTRRGRVRHRISKLLGRWYRYDGYFQIYNMPFRWLPLFDYSEKRDLYRPGGVLGGQPTVFDRYRQLGIPFHLSDWRQPDAANVAALRRDLERGRVRVAYLYTARMDAVLHEHGPGSPEEARQAEWYDEELRRLLATARSSYDEIRLAVFSDHGQAAIHSECDLMARVQASGLRFGEDYVAVYDSTMARIWVLRPEARERLLDALAGEPRGRVVTDAELASWGCDFPDRGYGEIFFLLEPGVLLNPSFMGECRLAGMHGYDPDDRDSVAMFSASHPPPRPLARLDDLHDHMLAEALWATRPELPEPVPTNDPRLSEAA